MDGAPENLSRHVYSLPTALTDIPSLEKWLKDFQVLQMFNVRISDVLPYRRKPLQVSKTLTVKRGALHASEWLED